MTTEIHDEATLREDMRISPNTSVSTLMSMFLLKKSFPNDIGNYRQVKQFLDTYKSFYDNDKLQSIRETGLIFFDEIIDKVFVKFLGIHLIIDEIEIHSITEKSICAFASFDVYVINIHSMRKIVSEYVKYDFMYLIGWQPRFFDLCNKWLDIYPTQGFMFVLYLIKYFNHYRTCEDTIRRGDTYNYISFDQLKTLTVNFFANKYVNDYNSKQMMSAIHHLCNNLNYDYNQLIKCIIEMMVNSNNVSGLQWIFYNLIHNIHTTTNDQFSLENYIQVDENFELPRDTIIAISVLNDRTLNEYLNSICNVRFSSEAYDGPFREFKRMKKSCEYADF